MVGLREYVRRRSGEVARIIAALLFDALLFVTWMAIDWAMQMIADFFSKRGSHTIITEIFHWVSSAFILVLALLYITDDVIHEGRRILRKLGWHRRRDSR